MNKPCEHCDKADKRRKEYFKCDTPCNLAKQLEQLRKPALLSRANGPCVSCKFEPECQWAHEFDVEDCKDWAAKEEDGE